MADDYKDKLEILWRKSRAGTLKSNDSIWKELRGKTNMSNLQKELDSMTVTYV